MKKLRNKNSIDKCVSLHRGFTLVEVLVAIVVLAIGVLAVSRLTVMGIRTSTLMNRRMYARDVLNRHHEQFMGLPTNDSILRHIASVDLDDTLTPDYEITEATGGGVFRGARGIHVDMGNLVPVVGRRADRVQECVDIHGGVPDRTMTMVPSPQAFGRGVAPRQTPVFALRGCDEAGGAGGAPPSTACGRSGWRVELCDTSGADDGVTPAGGGRRSRRG